MESKSYAALDLETLAALDPNTSYAKIREMVGSGKRVLDVGCGPGNLAAILTRAGNAVVGIDIDDRSLATAKRTCERTFKADLEQALLDQIVGDDRFDVVVFADLLEHVRQPAALLASARRVLRDGGCVIVSIPNVAHGAVRLALLRGRFEYQQLGVLDDSHLRFYTRDTVTRLLSESGFTAVRVERTTAPIFESSDLVPFVRREDHDAAVVADILRDEDAETLQFVVRACPTENAQTAAVLSAEITSLRQAVRTLRAQLAQPHENGAAVSAGEASRLAEVEQHYRNALALVDATRSERDDALAAAERARTEHEAAGAEGERLRAQLDAVGAEREERSAEVERLTAELARARAELAQRAADVEASAAALEDLRAQHEAAAGALRAELSSAHGLADGLRAQRDEAVARRDQGEAEVARATAAAAESQTNLELARAMVATLERDVRAEHDRAEALRAQHDELAATSDRLRAERDELAIRAAAAAAERDTALRAQERAEAEARAHVAQLKEELEAANALRDEAVAAHAAGGADLRRRAGLLEYLLAIERTTREHLDEACDRIIAVMRARAADAAHAELRRAESRSALVAYELRAALAAAPRVAQPRAPRPAGLRPYAVLRAATLGRRALTVLPPDPRRERVAQRWRRLRRLFRLTG